MGSATRKSTVYRNVSVSCPIGIYQWQASWPLIVEKKQWLNRAIGERKEKPDVLSVGLPAANYSFLAVIPENNISYIAFQHEQTHTHTYIYIWIYIFKQMKAWGRTTIIYHFVSFKGSATGKSYIYIHIYMFRVH